MSIAIHAAAIPPLRRMLENLSHLLAKAERHCEERKIEPSVLLAARLYPDMFPLVRQVQIASDTAKSTAARLAGTEIPKFEDTETTFPELHARIEKTIAFLDSLAPAQFEGAESRSISLPLRSGTREFTGQDYLLTWATPNFYFHVTAAYALLRHNGVEVGKMDYLTGGR
jgi:hypothetical protein